MAIAVTGLLWSQTQVDLKTQGKNVDFSKATSTKPSRTGTLLPVNCSLGETFFKTDAPAGSNLYGCTGTNVWSVLGTGVDAVTHVTGVLTLDLPVFGNGSGDVKASSKTGTGTQVVVSQSPTIVTPTITSFLNATHNHQNATGGGTLADSAVASGSKQGNGSKFQMFGGGSVAANDCAKFDLAGNLISAGAACGTGSGAVSSVFGRTGAVTASTGDYSFGQISGTAGVPQGGTGASTVAGARSNLGAAAAGVNADITSLIGLTTPLAPSQGGSGQANYAKGDMLVATSPASLARLSPGLNGQCLQADSTQPTGLKYGACASGVGDGGPPSGPAGGALGGSYPSPTLANLTTIGLIPFVTSSGILGQSASLAWNDTAKRLNLAGSVNIDQTAPAEVIQPGLTLSGGFANQNSGKSIDFFINNLTTRAARIANLSTSGDGHLAFFTSSSFSTSEATKKMRILGSGQTEWLDASGTVKASVSPAGQVFVNGGIKFSDGTIQTTAGASVVASVFGRTGAIAAQSGDYSFAQLSGILGSGQLPAAGGDLSGSLTAATVQGLRGRSVSNSAPGNGQALVWNGSSNQWEPQSQSAGGSNATQIQGRNVTNTAPLNGQALVWNTGSSQWQPGTVGGGGGGGGASMASQLGDCAVVRSSATVLTFGSNHSPATPCNVRFGSITYSISTSATAAIGSGTGTAYFYIADDGTLTVGHNLTVTCANCTEQGGVANFPLDVVPLFTWTATNGIWDSAGGSDRRAFLSSKTIVGGPGIAITETGAQTTVAVDTAAVPTYLIANSSLSFPNIGNGACAADQTFSLPGAAVGDTVAPGWPAGLEAGLLGSMRVSAANVVAVRLCNFSGVAVTPAGASFRAAVVRSF